MRARMRSRAHPFIIAHRGASGIAPESTRAAIQAAVRVGADMVELDVQMTRDGRLVVFHDARLERTTNGAGSLRHTRYAQLARLDAGSWFHRRFAGERILLVSQAIALIPRWMRINLELKRTTKRRALIRRLLQVVRRMRVSHRLLLSSFDPLVLKELGATRLARGFICREESDRTLTRAIQLGCQTWNPFHAIVTPRRVARAHTAGLCVYAWTVDDRSRARQLIRWGVDGIFTNHPERFVSPLGGEAVQ